MNRPLHTPALRRVVPATCAAVAALTLAAATAAAQPDASDYEPPDPATEPDPQKEIDNAVAASLHDRAQALFALDNYAGAKTLAVESLQRSPDGPVSAQARELVRKANAKLGVPNLDDGIPTGAASAAPPPLDPYADTDPSGADPAGPLDPYAGGADSGDTGTLDPLDPYAGKPDDADQPEPVPRLGGSDQDVSDWRRARRDLMLLGGLYGVAAGLTVAGPYDDLGEITGGAMLAGLVGGGAGLTLGYLGASRYRPSEGQAAVVNSGIAWGAATFGFFSDVVTGIDRSDKNDIYKGVALGGLLGGGVGVLLARRLDPSVGDVALTNSLGLYGGVGGLLVAVAIDPPETEAYSLNAVFGTAAGLAVGMLAARKVETSRGRMLWVDIGAMAGAAAPWVLLYPLFADDSGSGDEQAAGLLSTIGLLGGAYAAWHLTRDMDEAGDGDGDGDAAGRGAGLVRRDPAIPALVQRTGDGAWGVGVPALRPAVNPALAQPVGGAGAVGIAGGRRGIAIDLLGGRF